MKKQKESLSITDKLRQEAESFLNRQKKSDSAKSFSEADKLIHELRVHQIELELQNEELLLAKEKAEFAQKEYAELYDFAPAGHLSLSKAGEIINLNRSTEQLLGKERSSLIKSSFGFFVSPEMRALYNEFLKKVFRTDLIQTCELKLIMDDYSIRYVLVNGVSSKIDEKCLVTLTDITPHKLMEHELIKARQKAEENDRLKSAFLANMSHEIRTPMNGILGFTELLKNLDLTGQEKESYIYIIEKSGNRMLNIINDIISISRIEALETEVVVSNTNINEQLEYIYNFFKPEAEQKKLQLSINNALPKNEAFIRTDREKVYAILTNLVKNALKYTKSGSIEFGYEVKGEFLEIYVKDTGIGIPDEYKDNIFERFRQVSDTLNRNFEGFGLGLAISKAYVEMLGGEIWVESNTEQGSTFRFNLPFISAINTKEQFQTGIRERIIPNPKLKILVVDDDETSRLIMSLILRVFECQVIQADSGRDAVMTCRNNPDIDLVLMDIQMQGMDGYEATRQIRAFNKEVVIISQTALALIGDREDAIQAGCNNYISKPINNQAVLNLINQYVGDKSENDVIFS
jgi:signal transduction histidine kinase/ActR/RegA family two-component response regulator